jgi:trans-2,3-dihydro-3-hydroxyanthranilate isomerase
VTSTSTAELPFTLLDVFTDVPLAGNALAVVHDADGLSDETMLAFARETRLSETTFVQRATVEGADYRNRILSMAGELPFAGHPSLGTAVAVARRAGVRGGARYVQETGVGLQPLDVVIDGTRARASMLQEPPVFGQAPDPGALLDAIGLREADLAGGLPPQVVSTGIPHVLVPLASTDTLARAVPDPAAVDRVLARAVAYGLYLAALDPVDPRSVSARMFGRSAQVVEDPATGSAAGPLCAYLHRRMGLEEITITQGLQIGRPSRLDARIERERVRVAGACVLVLDGTARLPVEPPA